MQVKNVTLKNFRSYSRAGAEFSQGINVITGDNAEGKTNLLEAIFYLAGGRSFRAKNDGEIIKFGAEEASVKADALAGERDLKIEITLHKGSRKRLFVNGTFQKTAAEFSGRLVCVVFSPEGLSLVKEGAASRRRFLDQAIGQLRPKYAEAVSEFGSLYLHKTRILRDFKEKGSLLKVLEDFDVALARCGARLIRFRAAYTEKLALAAQKIHADFSGGESMAVKYSTVSTVKDPLGSPEAIFTDLMEHQLAHRDAELRAGKCLSGAHKDDLIIEISGAPARTFASQGQTRTAALSLKLAEREIAAEEIGEFPILLLDDVLSELDASRREFVLNRISGGQVFITCCEEENVASRTGGRALIVRNGLIFPISKGQ